MKKLFLSLVAAMLAVTATFAQSSLLATLSHNGTISTYYGYTALKDAYNKASKGDVITLSGGTFSAVNIDKGITIRGAGTGLDSKNQAEPTIIQGDFNIASNGGFDGLLTIEGIYSNNTVTIWNNVDVTFLKSRFDQITKGDNYSVGVNFTFIHCRIARLLRIGSGTSVSCVNSIIWFPENKESGDSNFEFNNCVVYRGQWAHQDLFRATFKNSILLVTTAVTMEKSNLFNNTLGVCTDGDANIFANALNNSNMQVQGYKNVFKSLESSYSDDETFELTDAAKAKYLGKDKTEVGMYGGNMPFDATPTNPQITKCNVAAKTTADGKLSVDIEVESAQ